jgi:hypothetical protein
LRDNGCAADADGLARHLAVAGCVLGLLVVCGKRSPPGENAPDAKGAALPSASAKSLEDYYIRQKAGVAAEKVPAETRSRLVGDLKKLHGAAAVGAQAVKPETANAIELSRLEILARSAAEAAGVYAATSTAELQQAYQQYLQTLPASEFHATHILMATESAASTMITKRQGGADFAEVAKSDSADDSKSKGGDLGWIHPGHLPPQFFAALKTLKPGEYTRVPVHTVRLARDQARRDAGGGAAAVRADEGAARDEPAARAVSEVSGAERDGGRSAAAASAGGCRR